jgi:uncharacterized membrane protein
MALKAWLYIGFTGMLVLVLLSLMVYYFKRERRERVESPKHRMLDED